MIYNITNHKIYIGQSNKLYTRFLSHKASLRSGKHSNKELQNDYNKGNCFVFTVLKKCKPEELQLLERVYIYSFLFRNIDLYNLETREQIKNLIFYQMVYPFQREIYSSFRKRYELDLTGLDRCRPDTAFSHVYK